MNTISSIAIIGIGATVGASCRYYIGILSMQYLGKALPYGTLISNVIGSFHRRNISGLCLGKALAQRDISIDAIGWINWFIDDNVCSFNRVS